MESFCNRVEGNGLWYDKETDLYYLDARHYDSKIARFINEDTYTGKTNDPLSLNLYTYCSNEPMMYWDPSGHQMVTLVDPLVGVIFDVDISEANQWLNSGCVTLDESEFVFGNIYNTSSNADVVSISTDGNVRVTNQKGSKIREINTGENSITEIINYGNIGNIKSRVGSKTNIRNSGNIGSFVTGKKSTNQVINKGTFFELVTGLGNTTTLFGTVVKAGGEGSIVAPTNYIFYDANGVSGDGNHKFLDEAEIYLKQLDKEYGIGTTLLVPIDTATDFAEFWNGDLGNAETINEVALIFHGSAEGPKGQGVGYMYLEGNDIRIWADDSYMRDGDICITDLTPRQIKSIYFSSCNSGNPDITNTSGAFENLIRNASTFTYRITAWMEVQYLIMKQNNLKLEKGILGSLKRLKPNKHFINMLTKIS